MSTTPDASPPPSTSQVHMSMATNPILDIVRWFIGIRANSCSWVTLLELGGDIVKGTER